MTFESEPVTDYFNTCPVSPLDRPPSMPSNMSPITTDKSDFCPAHDLVQWRLEHFCDTDHSASTESASTGIMDNLYQFLTKM